MGPKHLMKNRLQNQIDEARKYFKGNKYATCISLASNLLEQNNLRGCEEILGRLPTKDSLLESLVEKLKGKSVYKTLRQIHENKDVDDLVKLQGISSLITHAVIEIRHNHSEYKMLLPLLLEKENELIYGL